MKKAKGIGGGWEPGRCECVLLHDGEAETLQMLRLYKGYNFLANNTFSEGRLQKSNVVAGLQTVAASMQKTVQIPGVHAIAANAGFGTIQCRGGIEDRE